jgi:hypothetical protein
MRSAAPAGPPGGEENPLHAKVKITALNRIAGVEERANDAAIPTSAAKAILFTRSEFL